MKRTHSLAIATFFALVILVAFPRSSKAQWILLEDTAHRMVQEGLDEMYNMNHTKANEIFTSLTKMMPGHPAGHFLLALNDWWKIKPNIADKAAVDKYSKSFNSHIDRSLAICDSLLKENEFDIVGLFFKGAAYGYRARLKSSDLRSKSVTDWIGVLKDANEGRKMLLECQRLAPSNSDVLLGSGLILYWSEELPNQVSALKTLSLPPGDKQIGLQMIRISAEKALYTKVEAKYALLEILANNEKDWKQALTIADELYGFYPNNPDFHKYYARALYYRSQFGESDKEWRKLLKRVKDRQFGYELSLVRQGLYYLGDIQLRKGTPEPAEAVTILREAIKVNERLDEEDSGYYIASILRLGNAYDLLGKRKEALEQYNKVLKLKDVGNRHIKAKEYLTKVYDGK
ncbi:MAG: tetratricopeptide repeat protein [Candidatus Kapaibacterium sp.]